MSHPIITLNSLEFIHIILELASQKMLSYCLGVDKCWNDKNSIYINHNHLVFNVECCASSFMQNEHTEREH